MKKIFTFGSLAAIVAAFAVSMLGMQPAEAIVGGTNATQQYGTASNWTPPADGSAIRHRCHINVISKYWGVTSGHCREETIPGVTEVRASGLDITVPFSQQNPNGYKESVGVSAIYVHPGYVPDDETGAAPNDIALVKFANPIQLTKPLALPSNSSSVGTNAKLAGWGWDCDSDLSAPNCGLPLRFSAVLQELGVKIVNTNECTYPHDATQYFCIKAAADINAMACVGDSGAPITRKSFDQLILTGITMGDGDLVTDHVNFCGSNVEGGKGSSLVVDIAYYKQWIRDTIFAHSAGNSAHMPKFTNVNQ